jgi:O-antigen/teichoic acid export membrane protein
MGLAAHDRRLGGLPLYYFGFGLSRLATVAVLPIASRQLGRTDYGHFETTLAVMLASVVLVDAGVAAALIRYYGDERYSRRAMLWSSAAAQLGASIVAWVVFLTPLLLIAPTEVSDVGLAAILAAFTIIEGVSILGSALLRSQERFLAFFNASLARLLLAVGLGWAGAIIWGLEGALLAVSCAGLSFAAMLAVALRRQTACKPERALVVKLVTYGLPLISTSVMTWALSLSDRVFLQQFHGPDAVADYSPSYRIGSVVGLFIAGPLAIAWVPRLLSLRGAVARHQESVRWARGLAVVALGGAAVLTLTGPWVVPLIFGHQYDAVPVIIAGSAVSGWLFGLYFLLASNVLAGDRTTPLAYTVVLIAVLNLVLNAVLVPPFEADGALAATVASYAALVAATAVVAARHGPIKWLWSPGHIVPAGLLLAAVGCSAFLT